MQFSECLFTDCRDSTFKQLLVIDTLALCLFRLICDWLSGAKFSTAESLDCSSDFESSSSSSRASFSSSFELGKSEKLRSELLCSVVLKILKQNRYLELRGKYFSQNQLPRLLGLFRLRWPFLHRSNSKQSTNFQMSPSKLRIKHYQLDIFNLCFGISF